MASAWSAAQGAFSFSAGSLSGSLERAADGRSLAVQLGDVRLGALGELAWQLERDGSTGSVQPAADVAYIQQPYVVCPFMVETPSEFRLTAFFRATDEGVDADFRLATVWPVENVTLALHTEWPALAYRELLDGLTDPTRLNKCPGCAVGTLETGSGIAALLTDVGEHGEFQPTPRGAILRLFDQPLEKGVILVGRFALRPFVDHDRLRRDFADWLDHPTASL